MPEPCVVARDGESVSRYVAGTLSREELEEFEVHLLACGECQAAVREAAALSAGLRELPPTPARRRALPAALVATAAAVVAAVVFWPQDELRLLGAVDEVPTFAGIPVRADGDSTTSLADRGMAAYGQEDWAQAAELLGRAARMQPSPALRFFQGVSHLMAGDPEAASPALTAVLSAPDGPYVTEARLYLAKALLRLRRPEEALVHLDAAAENAAPAAGGGARRHAAALADSVREALER